MTNVLKGPVVANKWRPVPTKRDDDRDAPGSWAEVIHDCELPSIQEIIKRAAAVGSVWKCGDSNCGDQWVLRRNKDYKLDDRPTLGARAHGMGLEANEHEIADENNRKIAEALQWVRKRDIKDQEH